MPAETNRAAHLPHVIDFPGHPITLVLVGLAFGLVTDTEQVNTARSDVPQLIETADTRAQGAKLTATERQIWDHQVAAFRT